MKKIPLSQGKSALVDDDNFEELNRFKWSAMKVNHRIPIYYAYRAVLINGKRRVQFMHRTVLNLPHDRERLVDHKDHDGLNNQRSNLREVTRTQNTYNMRSLPGSYSKFVGVTWNKGLKKWQAQIKNNGKNLYLGLFLDEREAAIARDAAAKFTRGEYAHLNFP